MKKKLGIRVSVVSGGKMFKCQLCKEQSEKGEPQFKLYTFKKKKYANGTIGFEPEAEKKVCGHCAIAGGKHE